MIRGGGRKIENDFFCGGGGSRPWTGGGQQFDTRCTALRTGGGMFFMKSWTGGGRGSGGPASHTRPFPDLVPPPRAFTHDWSFFKRAWQIKCKFVWDSLHLSAGSSARHPLMGTKSNLSSLVSWKSLERSFPGWYFLKLKDNWNLELESILFKHSIETIQLNLLEMVVCLLSTHQCRYSLSHA